MTIFPFPHPALRKVAVTDKCQFISNFGGSNSPQSGNVDVGTAGFIVLAMGHSRSSGAQSFTSVTIDGVAATIIQGGANSRGSGIAYIGALKSGSIPIVITASATATIVQASVYKLLGLASMTPFDFNFGSGADISLPLDLPANGVLIAAAVGGINNASPLTLSGVASLQMEQAFGASSRMAAGHTDGTSAATGHVVQATSANTTEWLAVASWQ